MKSVVELRTGNTSAVKASSIIIETLIIEDDDNLIHHHNTSDRTSTSFLPTNSTNRTHQNNLTMSDAKQQIMDQVRQQAALQNARALVEVSTHPPSLPYSP